MNYWDKANKIVKEVCRYYNIDDMKLYGNRQDFLYTKARHVAMKLMESAGHKNVEIAEFINRDHATVTHGLKRAGESYMDDVKAIEEILKQGD